MSVQVEFPFPRNTRDAKPRGWFRTDDADGDSLHIEQPVRLVSVDTPEKASYAGKPERSQPKLDRTRERLLNGFFGVPPELVTYLAERLTPDAAQRHIEASLDASEALERLFEERLRRDDGTLRKLAVIPTGGLLDTHNRLLAYLAPWFPTSELPPRSDPRRHTFNLLMVAAGWAAPFPVYPSLPGNEDMNLFLRAAEAAWDEQRGVWARYGRDLLLAYEYRACIKLSAPLVVALREGATREFFTQTEWEAARGGLGEGWEVRQRTPSELVEGAFERHCVDLRTSQDRGPFGFCAVPPPYRLWFWAADEAAARRDLALR